jgi:hypothetical protein
VKCALNIVWNILVGGIEQSRIFKIICLFTHLIFNSIDLRQEYIPSVLSALSPSFSRCEFTIEQCQLVLQSTHMRTKSEDPIASDVFLR